MSHMKSISRFGLPALCGGVMVAFFGVVPGPARPVQAAFVEQGKGGPQLLIGRDDDNIGNVDIQAGAAANQSLDRTDIIEGGPGNDVIFGLNGNDVIDGGPGSDIILGGPDGGTPPGGPPNSDIMFGGPGNDVNLWAPGDGSEAFIGGPGLTQSCLARRTARPTPIRRRVFGCRPCCSVFQGFHRAYPPRM